MIYLYVLVAIALPTAEVAKSADQTITYHATMKECIEERNRVEQTINKSYVRLECKPIKVQ